MTQQKPLAQAYDIAEHLIDTDPYGRMNTNGLICSYTLRNGLRATEEIVREGISLYHSWMAEQESDARRGLSMYYAVSHADKQVRPIADPIKLAIYLHKYGRAYASPTLREGVKAYEYRHCESVTAEVLIEAKQIVLGWHR